MITIKKTAYEEIVAHARSGVPNEVCGYGAGVDGVITRIYKMKNVSPTPLEFFNFDEKEMFDILRLSRKEGVKFLMVYHSHPTGGDKPSSSDMDYLGDPNYQYIIISLQHEEPIVNGFWIKNKQYGNLEIKIID